MTEHRIRVTQEFVTTRSIIITVTAGSIDEALEQVTTGAIDTPEFDDPSWRTSWTLRSERAEAALAQTPSEV